MDAALLDWLASAHTLTLGNGRINFISFVVSMTVIEMYKSRQKAPVEWWRAFTVCCVWWFGGGTSVAILTGEPVGWIRAPDVYLGFALSWWLMLYCPGDSWFRLFVKVPVRALVMVIEGVNSAVNMITAVSMCLAHVSRTEVPPTAKPSLFLVCILCAFLFDQAGGLIVYYCNLVDSPPNPAGMQYGIHRSLTLAVVYTAVVFNVLGLLPAPVSRGHIVFFLTLISFVGDLTFYTTRRDVFTPLWSKLLHVVNIPLVVPGTEQLVQEKQD